MKTIIILITLLSINTFAKGNKEPFHWNMQQGVNDYGMIIDTKNFEKLEKEKPFRAEQYNSLNKIHFFFGVQEDQYEEESGIFLTNITPSAHINWDQKFNKYIGYELEGQISKNNFIAKQLLIIGTETGLRREFFLIGQVGQKVALVKQEKTGYLFLNYGAGWIERFNNGFRTDLRAYLSNQEYNLWGWELRALKKVKEAEVGVYIAVEQYNPFSMEYERQGQTSSRFGLIFSY